MNSHSEDTFVEMLMCIRANAGFNYFSFCTRVCANSGAIHKIGIHSSVCINMLICMLICVDRCVCWSVRGRAPKPKEAHLQ